METGNIGGVGGGWSQTDPRPDLPPPGLDVVADGDGSCLTNDGTGHGMFIGSDTTVNPF